jgi:hypothetical protein
MLAKAFAYHEEEMAVGPAMAADIEADTAGTGCPRGGIALARPSAPKAMTIMLDQGFADPSAIDFAFCPLCSSIWK